MPTRLAVLFAVLAALLLPASALAVPATVTIDQRDIQSDPTSTSPIEFIARFSVPVSGFTEADVALSGTAGATTVVISPIGANSDQDWLVQVSGMTSTGTVIVNIPAAAATSQTGGEPSLASTSTDNTVTYNGPPTAVTLRSFGATQVGGDVVLRWRTASVLETLGFDVYREVRGKRVKVNRSLIATRSTGSYSFVDRRAPRSIRGVRYWLRVTAIDGSRRWLARAPVS